MFQASLFCSTIIYFLRSRHEVPRPIQLDSNRRRSIVTRSTHLQHVEQGGLSGIVQTKEKKLSVLVQQAKRGEHIVDYKQTEKSHQ